MLGFSIVTIVDELATIDAQQSVYIYVEYDYTFYDYCEFIEYEHGDFWDRGPVRRAIRWIHRNKPIRTLLRNACMPEAKNDDLDY